MMCTDLSCSHKNLCSTSCTQAGAHCGKCGQCSSGTGCDSCSRPLELTLTETELCLLKEFAQFAFLPVACAEEQQPVYLEPADEIPSAATVRSGNPVEQISRCLLALQAKGLISIDYDLPLQGFHYAPYASWPIHGSMALTELGQTVLDSLDAQLFS